MTNKNEMPLKPCPFCGGNTNSMIGTSPHDEDFPEAICCDQCGSCLFGSGWDEEQLIKQWNTRAAEPQPPVIEGLDEAIEDLENNVCGRGSISDYSDNSLDTVLKAARLYAQGQTAQPVDLDALKKPSDWSPTSKREFHLANYGWNACIDHLASRGTIVTAQQPNEDAQRALDQIHLIVFDGCDDADKVMETIRAALARGLGE